MVSTDGKFSQQIATVKGIRCYCFCTFTGFKIYCIHGYFYQMVSNIQNTITPVILIVVIRSSVKRRITNTHHTIRNLNTRQTATARERIPTDARHSHRDLDARQTATARERTPTDARHSHRDLDARQVITVAERIKTDARHACWNLNTCQTATARERIIADARHVCRDDNVFDTSHSINQIRVSIDIRW